MSTSEEKTKADLLRLQQQIQDLAAANAAAAANPTNAPTVNRVGIKIGPFWKRDPALWFAQIETQFQLARITEEEPAPQMQKQRHQRKNTHHTKELGRWKPMDDLMLILGVQQSNDLNDAGPGDQPEEAAEADNDEEQLTDAALQNLAQKADAVADISRPQLFSAAKEPNEEKFRTTEMQQQLDEFTCEVAALRQNRFPNEEKFRTTEMQQQLDELTCEVAALRQNRFRAGQRNGNRPQEDDPY